MTFIKHVAAALLFSLLATQGAASVGCAIPADANRMATDVAAGLNAHRQANSLAPVTFNRVLAQAAATHACDMGRNRFFTHRGSDGTDPQARARRAGYRDCLIAENLAWGFPQPARIIDGWMASPGHRQNMMHGRIKEFGIGIANGDNGPIWVLVLASSC